ncbi:MAG: hypothetical protein ABI273_04880 [Lacunisphaera sp.]
MNPDRLWLRFVRLSLLCALVPGFSLATLMVSAWLFGQSPGLWYLAAIQTHAFALLTGWGGAMILGVALHFLPRLRGVKLVRPEWVARLFWLLAIGLTCRIVGQPLLALLVPTGPRAAVAWLNAVIAVGAVLSALAVVGLLAVLITTFRAGPPLGKNHGFKQIAPLLMVAALALSLAQLVWAWGAAASLVQGRSLAVFPAGVQELAVDLMLFGFIAAIGVAMSSRLFPLTFRIKLPQPRALRIAGGLLAGGVLCTAIAGLQPAFALTGLSLGNWAAVFYAGGLLVGVFAVRIFQTRKPILHAVVPYRITEDPAAVGVLSAYIWVVVGAGLLLLLPLQAAGVPIPGPLLQKNLARHAIGLGFMTLLIMSVGWKMLPGFGGGQPRGRGLVWSAVSLANLAVLLRILPALFPSGNGPGRSWSELLFPCAGMAALAAILAFAIALQLSFRKPAKPGDHGSRADPTERKTLGQAPRHS